MTTQIRRTPGALPTVLVPLAAGALFGGGLALGAMTDPERVLGFLDLFGSWDPTLVFVMAGATTVMALAWLIRPHFVQPVFGDRFAVPGRRDIDMPLLAGSALFGIGWGLAGICPGPAVALVAFDPGILVFIAAMLAGMLLHRFLDSAFLSHR